MTWLKKAAKAVIEEAVLDLELPLRYRWAARKPVDPDKVVFVTDGRDEAGSFAFAMSYLQRNYRLDVHHVSLARNQRTAAEYNRMCLEFMDDLATASYVVLGSASRLVGCAPLRPETKIVQLRAACNALERWGLSCAGNRFDPESRRAASRLSRANYALVSISAEEVGWIYRQAMGLPKSCDAVRALGISHTDRFFDRGFLEQAHRDLYSEIPAALGKKVLLYAPAYRGRASHAQAPRMLGIEALLDKLGEEWVLLVKHHRLVRERPPIPDACKNGAFDVSSLLSTDALLVVADALVTDYSPVMFDYALTNRPMCFFAYDLHEYERQRGFYYSYEDIVPGPILRTVDEVAAYVLSTSSGFDEAPVAAFRSRFMSACDGRSTARICEELFGGPMPASNRPQAWERMADGDPDGIDISVIIPAYNAAASLERALESVATQPYPMERMELIVVDDCSADETVRVVERFAEKHPGLIRLAVMPRNSGTGAAPRNVGLDMARGRFVFFLDADDWLGADTLPVMLDYALDWGSDVLLVRMVGENGRKVPRSMFDCNWPQVDVWHSKVAWTLGPVKLFRRALLEDNGIRFPEGVMPEDISFVLRAYALASTVSVAADLDYYHCSWDGADGSHLSVGTWDDPERNFRAFDEIFAIVRELVPANARDCSLMRRLFRRDGFNILQTILRQNEPLRSANIDRFRNLFGPYWRPAMQGGMPCEMRAIFDEVLHSA